MRVILAALCLLAVTNTWAAVGTVSDHKGTNCGIERNKQKLSGEKGAGMTVNVYPSPGMDETELASLVSRQIAFSLRRGGA